MHIYQHNDDVPTPAPTETAPLGGGEIAPLPTYENPAKRQ